MRACTFLDISDYVVSCGWTDNNQGTLFVVRRSGSVSLMQETSLEQSEMMALALIATQMKIQEDPQIYFSLRQAPTSVSQTWPSDWLELLRSRIVELTKQYSNIPNAFAVDDLTNFAGIGKLETFLRYLLGLRTLVAGQDSWSSVSSAVEAWQFRSRADAKRPAGADDCLRKFLTDADRLAAFELLV